MLAVLLVLGLSTSLLVAWAGALVDRSAWPLAPLTGTPTGTRTAMRGWLVEAGRDRTLSWRTFDALDLWDEPPDLDAPTTLPSWSVGHALPDQPGPFAPTQERTLDQAWEVSAGWPMRCVRAMRTAGPTEFALPGEFVRGGFAAMAVGWPMPTDPVTGHERIVLDPWPTSAVAAIVPLRPMPVGLLVNTVVFAVLWFVALLPLVALRAVRRWRRARRNRCVACGYARDGLPAGAPCAECGCEPAERTTVAELLTARAPMLGAALALALVIASSAALPVHRWMAVDRLPPLHHAAAVGDVERIERLIADGASVSSPRGSLAGWDASGEATTVMQWAAARGRGAAIEALLNGGGSMFSDDIEHWPIALAFKRGHDHVARWMLGGCTERTRARMLPMVLPYVGDAMREWLLREHEWRGGGTFDARARALLAADIELYERLDRLISPTESAYATKGDYGAIEADARAWASPWRHDLGMTRYLLERGRFASQSSRDHALEHVIDFRPSLAALVLLEAGAVPHADAMVDAAFHGQAEIIRALLDYGIDPDASERSTTTPMFMAIFNGHADAVAALLDGGAHPIGPDPSMSYVRAFHIVQDARPSVPSTATGNPFNPRPEDAERIVEMLQAAEAAWRARQGSAEDADAAGGP